MTVPASDDRYLRKELAPLINRAVITPKLKDGSLTPNQLITLPARTSPETVVASLQKAMATDELSGATIIQPVAFRVNDQGDVVNYSTNGDLPAHVAMLVVQDGSATYIDPEGYPLPAPFEAKLKEFFGRDNVDSVILTQQTNNTDCGPLLVYNAEAVAQAVSRGEEISAATFRVPTAEEVAARRKADAPALKEIRAERNAYMDASVGTPGYQPKSLSEHLLPTPQQKINAENFTSRANNEYKNFHGKAPETRTEKLRAYLTESLKSMWERFLATFAQGGTDFLTKLEAHHIFKAGKVRSSSEITTPSLVNTYDEYFGATKFFQQLVGDAPRPSAKSATPSSTPLAQNTGKFISEEVKRQARAAVGAPSAPPAAPAADGHTPSAPPLHGPGVSAARTATKGGGRGGPAS